MSSSFYIKRGDTLPVMEVTLLNADLLTPYDLTGAAVKLRVTVNGVAIFRSMTIVGSPTAGKVQYAWQASDWTFTPPSLPAISEGTHPMEVEVVPQAGGRLTFPNTGCDLLVVSGDLGDA
jgi:hypothetical protein